MKRYSSWIKRFSFPLLAVLVCGCQKPAEIKPDFVHQDAHTSGNLVQITSDLELGISAGLGGGIKIWDLRSGDRLASWQAHDGPVNGVVVLPQQRQLVSGGWDGKLKRWQLSGQLLQEVQTGSPVSAMTRGPTGQLLSGHDDAAVRYWQIADLQLQSTSSLQGSRIQSLAYHTASSVYAASDTQGRVWYWLDAQAPKQLAKLSSYIRSLVFSADGRQLFGGTWFDLYRWELPSGEMQVLDTDHRGIIVDLAWSQSENDMVSISRQTDASVLALDPLTGATRTNYGEHDLCGASIAISDDGKYLMTTSDDASVRIWQLPR